MNDLIGVARERLYSPGKVRADRAILDAVSTRLRDRHRVRVVAPESCTAGDVGPGSLVLTMCQGEPALALMHRWQAAGAHIVNSPAAIWNCRRVNTIAAWRAAGVPHPPTAIIDTTAETNVPRWASGEAWIKRGDVHAVQAGDVVRRRGADAIRAQLGRLQRRGINTAVVQQHIAGPVVKFYAVVGSTFFACFPERDAPAICTAEDTAAIRALVERGAAAVGIEVFGGDVVRCAEHGWMLIDLNDWPSYAPCLHAAADAIAAYITAQHASSVT